MVFLEECNEEFINLTEKLNEMNKEKNELMNKTSNYYDVYRISSILRKINSIENDIKSKKETI